MAAVRGVAIPSFASSPGTRRQRKRKRKKKRKTQEEEEEEFLRLFVALYALDTHLLKRSYGCKL